MKKELKDYLHFYPGCQLQLQTPKKEIVTLGAIGFVNPDRITVRFKDNDEWSYADYDEFKPILRPLSDIKDNEVDRIASILLGKKVENLVVNRVPAERDGDSFFLTAYWKRERDIAREDTEIEMGFHISNIGEAFGIDHVWNYIRGNGTGVSHEPLHNSHDITLYLLKQGFDLFNLIPEGLAIDSTVAR